MPDDNVNPLTTGGLGEDFRGQHIPETGWLLRRRSHAVYRVGVPAAKRDICPRRRRPRAGGAVVYHLGFGRSDQRLKRSEDHQSSSSNRCTLQPTLAD
jgi:hypothetical protein